MSPNKNKIKLMVAEFLTSGLHINTDFEINRKANLLNIIGIIGIINLLPLSIISFIRENSSLGYFELFSVYVLITILILLRKIGYNIIFSYIGVSFVGSLFIYLFATGGFNNTGHLWCYTFPLFTLFLLGPKKGIIATLILLSFLILIFVIEDHSLITATYSRDFKIRFIISFVVVLSLTIAFEQIRENIQLKLTEKNSQLTKIIYKYKKIKDALKDSETLLKATLESTADGILVVDKSGKTVAKNHRFGQMWGIPEDVLKTNDDDKLLSFILSKLKDPNNFLLKVKKLYNTDQQDFDNIDFSDGRVFERYSEPLIVDDDIAGRVWSFRDVTDRKQAEEEKGRLQSKLKQAEKMEAVGTLAGGVAHDLNNVLQSVVCYPELILMDLPEESPIRNSMITIQQSGMKAAAIVQDLLTLARRGVSVSEVMNLNDIISEYFSSPEFEKLKSFQSRVQIESQLDSELLNIMGSPVHLSKTIMNLVSNAAEAMPNGGKIHVSTESIYLDYPIRGYDDIEVGDYVILTVTDTGIGISPEEIRKIFDPFYTKKVMGRSGTGLGMSVVWGTVKDHKGYINVESKLEEGSTFKLYFPVTRKEKTDKPNKKEITDFMGNGESILVIDDMKEQQMIALKILTQLGYSVKTVSGGEEAVELLKSCTVDLILLDMVMDPGIDGLETYERISEIHPNQKAVIASGFSKTKKVINAQRMGAGQYIKKPYTIDKIGMAVRFELNSEKIAA